MAKHPEIPEEYALQGFAGVRAYAIDPERTRSLLEETLAFEPRGENEWEARGDKRGGFYAYDPAPEGRGIPAQAPFITSRGRRRSTSRRRGSNGSPRRACGRRP